MVSPNAAANASTSAPTISSYQANAAGEGRVAVPATSRELIPTIPAPASLSAAAFRDRIESSWLFEHYRHRPALQKVFADSESHTFGTAAVSAATAMSSTLFAKFHNLSLGTYPNLVQFPYSEEYASAVQALSTQLPLFKLDSLEEVLVPALLLFIAEVRT